MIPIVASLSVMTRLTSKSPLKALPDEMSPCSETYPSYLALFGRHRLTCKHREMSSLLNENHLELGGGVIL